MTRQPANLLVGSTIGVVYIVRCDPTSGRVSLKTSIDTGEAPIQVLVDVSNKCFYCLDASPSAQTGHLATLAPTEVGTIEESIRISSGKKNPTSMINVGKYIFITHESGYSIVKSPIVSKSTRRRRLSTLQPVTEDAIAEGLDVLYNISKSLDNDNSNRNNPASAIASIQHHLTAETSVDVIELQQVIPTTNSILKFVSYPGDLIIGLMHNSFKSFTITKDGQLLEQRTVNGANIVDGVSSKDSLFVLSRGQLSRYEAIGEDDFIMREAFTLASEEVISVVISQVTSSALVLCETKIISVSLVDGEQSFLDVVGTSMVLSDDEDLLFVANNKQHELAMYTLEGHLIGHCSIEHPASIIHMS